ncbi:LuxR C-terminal-related transcriptional regulator [Actinophytocola sp. NPDC049390]|uniref:helix-turn-helix transcriptional regulator n=1 Tax=Actinophytocola sp. NPDC049390 TaxID=3363894 RepID=UPI0037B2523D
MSRRFGELIDALARPGVSRLSVCAPAGHGKSAVLAEVAAQLRATGVHVVYTPEETDPGSVLVVDDAHRLGPDQLDRARDHALSPSGSLVLAYRPDAATAKLRALLDATPGLSFTLSPLAVDQVTAILTARLGIPVPDAVARRVHAYTGGVPRYVAWLGEAVHEGQAAAEQHAATRLADFMVALDPPMVWLLTVTDVCGPGAVDVLGHVLGTSRVGVADQIRSAQAAALTGHDGTPLPVVARALRSERLSAYRSATLHVIAEARHRAGHSMRHVAEALLACGATGSTAAATYLAGAREFGRDQPDRAAALYAAAAEAGAPFVELGPQWAETAALSGDFDTAMRLAEPMLASADEQIRSAAAGIGAAVAAHRADLVRSAELGLWSDSASRHHAVIGFIGAGLVDRAREVSKANADRAVGVPPTAMADAAARTASAIEQSISAQPARALPALLGVAALAVTERRLLPDSPAALAAITGVHSGELALAHAVLDRALTVSAEDAHVTRHRVLLGMVALAHGNTSAARDAADSARGSRWRETRDELFLTALEVGIARRQNNPTALAAAWRDAYQTMMATRLDLFTLLPLTELLVAAARLGESPRLRTHLDQVEQLLAALHYPPLWTTNLRWAQLHAAVLNDDRVAAGTAASELGLHANTSRYTDVLAHAARTWTAVLGGSIEPAEVAAVADDLHAFGLHGDAAHLAAHAATRTLDRAATVTLLETARRVRGGADAAGPAVTNATALLSGREVEVARLVVAGLTYKQIGARLYISGKTVEHHVAKVRTKLGATDRRDLLRRLRDAFGHDPDGEVSPTSSA